MVDQASRHLSWTLQPCTACIHWTALQHINQWAMKCQSLLAFVKYSSGAERPLTLVSNVLAGRWMTIRPVHMAIRYKSMYVMHKASYIFNCEEYNHLKLVKVEQDKLQWARSSVCMHLSSRWIYYTAFIWLHNTSRAVNQGFPWQHVLPFGEACVREAARSLVWLYAAAHSLARTHTCYHKVYRWFNHFWVAAH